MTVFIGYNKPNKTGVFALGWSTMADFYAIQCLYKSSIIDFPGMIFRCIRSEFKT